MLPFRRGFFSFFVAQLLSAFNDNLWKSAAVAWIAADRAHVLNVRTDAMVALCSGLYILPFLLFSGTAGQLADRFEKPRLIRYVKLAEIGIMAVGGLALARTDLGLSLAALFLLGVHSAFLGPIKYAIVPQLVPDDDQVVANGLVVMSTFLAIIAGTIAAALLMREPDGLRMIGIPALAVAVLGYQPRAGQNAAQTGARLVTEHRHRQRGGYPIHIEAIRLARGRGAVCSAMIARKVLITTSPLRDHWSSSGTSCGTMADAR